MFTRKSLPVATLVMILVLALAAIGVGYALWSETLTVTGNVSTGEVDVAFSNEGVRECVDVGDQLCQPEPPEKASAANCNLLFNGPDGDSPDDDGADGLTVNVVGAYPSWHCLATFNVDNVGNVPVLVYRPEKVQDGFDNPEWVKLVECYDDGTQIEATGDPVFCTIDIHFENEEAEEKTNYTFQFTIEARQWNEPRQPSN